MKRLSIGSLFTALIFAGCVQASDDTTEIDDYVRSLNKLETSPSQVEAGQRSAEERLGDYSCTRQDYTETRQYDRIVAYSANSDSMWPGAILHGNSVYDGLFAQAVFDRRPLDVSVSLENLAGGPSATMEGPDLSSFRDAISSILNTQVNGDTPANIFAEIEEVHSSEQLAIALGAGVSGGVAPFSISASFDFNDTDVKSRYVVKYVQAYYTVDVDAPGKASDWLADSVTLAEVEEAFKGDDPPVYVSSVTYGRTVLFTFESNYSASELASALEFTYSGGVDVSGDVSVTYEEMVSQSNITAYILGGSGGDAAQAIDGYEELREFIRSGGNYSPESPGAPIAYKLSYLADNQPARVSFTRDYQTQECVRVSQKVLVTLDSITVEDGRDEVGSGGNLEVYGVVRAIADNDVELLNWSETQNVRIDEGQTYPTTNQPLGEAILQVTPQAGNAINLHVDMFDKDGLSGDDDFPVVIEDYAFETGWRRDVSVVTSHDGSRMRLNFSLQPI